MHSQVNVIHTHIKEFIGKMFFSIIIPVYNAEGFISLALNSILSQDFSDYEIVCVNDASVDASLNILEKYSMMHTNIKIVDLVKNSGAVFARDKGLEVAKGDYIIFLDADDELSLGALSQIYCSIISNSEVDAVCLNMKSENENAYQLWKGDSVYNGYDAFIMMLEFKFPRIVAVRKSICLQVRLENITLEAGEGNFFDEYLWLKQLLACRNVVVAKKCYYYYRSHSSQATNPTNIRFYDKLKRSRLVNELVKKTCDDSVLLSYRRFMIFELSWHYVIFSQMTYLDIEKKRINNLLKDSFLYLKEENTFQFLFSKNLKNKILAFLFTLNWSFFKFFSQVRYCKKKLW